MRQSNIEFKHFDRIVRHDQKSTHQNISFLEMATQCLIYVDIYAIQRNHCT